MSLDLG